MRNSFKFLAGAALAGAFGLGTALATGVAGLPGEVRNGSVKLTPDAATRADYSRLARTPRAAAEAAALAVQPGQVVQAELDDEDGQLVWEVKVRHPQGTTEFAVDAGDGRVLAAEREDDDDRHSEHPDAGREHDHAARR